MTPLALDPVPVPVAIPAYTTPGALGLEALVQPEVARAGVGG